MKEIINKINLWNTGDVCNSPAVSLFDKWCSLSQLKFAIQEAKKEVFDEIEKKVLVKGLLMYNQKEYDKLKKSLRLE